MISTILRGYSLSIPLSDCSNGFVNPQRSIQAPSSGDMFCRSREHSKPCRPMLTFGLTIAERRLAELRQQRMEQMEREHPDNEATKSDKPVAVVEIANREIRTLIRYPNGKFYELRQPVNLSDPLRSEFPGIPYETLLLNAIITKLRILHEMFSLKGVEAAAVVGTKALEGLSPQFREMLQRAYNVDIITPEREGTLTRQAVLREQSGDADKLVVVVGGATSKIAFDDPSKNIRLDIGWQSYPGRNTNSFDPETVVHWKEEFVSELSKHQNKLQEKQLYIPPLPEYQEMLDLSDTITKETIDASLTVHGLRRLRDFREQKDLEAERLFIGALPFRFAFLSALMEVANAKTLHVGHGGGLKLGLMQDAIKDAHSDLELREEIRKRVGVMSNNLANAYMEQKSIVESNLAAYFGSPAGEILVRAKNTDSIADKLVKKIAKSQGENRRKSINQAVSVSESQKLASSLIGDGVGVRIVLAKGDEQEVQAIVDAMSKAIREGHLEVLEIHNYAGAPEKPDGRSKDPGGCYPYFTDKHILSLLKATRQAAGGRILTGVKNAKGETELVPITPENAKNVLESKDSGYTAVHLNLVFKHPETHQVLGTGELQIRGSQVDGLAEIEHFVYDLLQGKTLTTGKMDISLQNSLKRFRSSALGISKKLGSNWTVEDVENFYEYFQEQYKIMRERELGVAGKALRPAKIIQSHPWLKIRTIEKLKQRVDACRSS